MYEKNKYWSEKVFIKNVIHTLSENDGEEWSELIVEIHIPDSYGRYIPRELFKRLKDVAEEDYPYEIGSEEEVLAFDELVEEVNDELQEIAKKNPLLMGGVGIVFGWHDGEIRTVLYQEEGN